MLLYLARRMALAVPLALGAATLVFLILESAPGDPSDLLLGDRAIPTEVRERLDQLYGLDRTPTERYVLWLSTLCRGDLGWSVARSRPVGELIGETLPVTASLALAALFIHVVTGVTLGALSAARRGSWVDRTLGAASMTLYAMPVFWVAIMAILLLSYWLPIFPASSIASVGHEQLGPGQRLADRLWHLLLPALVLGVASAAVTARLVRAGTIEAMQQGFVRAARARGLARQRVLVRHAMRNALLPVVNLIGMSLPALLSGSLIVEVVFAWPGMGRLTYDAILARDFPVVMGTTVLATLLVVLGSLAADLAMASLDPRVRLTARGRP